MKTTLTKGNLVALNKNIQRANKKYKDSFPGESFERQPVHTLYGGAHLFKFDSAPKISQLALKGFQDHAKDPQTFAKGLGLEGSSQFFERLYKRVETKLTTEALEDFRIDFEDGFGHRPDKEEDETAAFAAADVATAQAR